MVEGDGFEPSKLTRQIYSLLPLATREPLQRVFLYLINSFPNRAIKLSYSLISSKKNDGGGGRIRTMEAYAADLQSAPFGHSGTAPTGIFILN